MQGGAEGESAASLGTSQPSTMLASSHAPPTTPLPTVTSALLDPNLMVNTLPSLLLPATPGHSPLSNYAVCQLLPPPFPTCLNPSSPRACPLSFYLPPLCTLHSLPTIEFQLSHNTSSWVRAWEQQNIYSHCQSEGSQGHIRMHNRRSVITGLLSPCPCFQLAPPTGTVTRPLLCFVSPFRGK